MANTYILWHTNYSKSFCIIHLGSSLLSTEYYDLIIVNQYTTHRRMYLGKHRTFYFSFNLAKDIDILAHTKEYMINMSLSLTQSPATDRTK